MQVSVCCLNFRVDQICLLNVFLHCGVILLYTVLDAVCSQVELGRKLFKEGKPLQFRICFDYQICFLNNYVYGRVNGSLLAPKVLKRDFMLASLGLVASGSS